MGTYRMENVFIDELSTNTMIVDAADEWAVRREPDAEKVRGSAGQGARSLGWQDEAK